MKRTIQLSITLSLAIILIGTFIFIKSNPKTQQAVPKQSTTNSTMRSDNTNDNINDTQDTVSQTDSQSNPYSNWQVYQNPKYDFQFKYDPRWELNDYIQGFNQYDRIVIRDITNNTISIIIDMPQFDPQPILVEDIYNALQEKFGPTKEITTTNFGKNNIYAVVRNGNKNKTYYFLHRGLVFSIYLQNITSKDIEEIYDHFLDEFSLL